MTSDDIPPGPYSEDDLRQQWNAQADEFNQWDSLDFSEQLAWAQARAIAADRNRCPAARAALAQPEGEGSRELQCPASVARGCHEAAAEAESGSPLQQLLVAAGDLLERGGPHPAPPAPEVGDVGELVAYLRRHSSHPEARRAATLLQQLSAPAPAAVPPAVYAPPSDELRKIGYRLRTQDNRCTADPIFQVRGLRRIYGMDPAYADTTVWIDTEGEPIEVEPPADPEKPGDFVINTAYQDHWEVIMTAFSERACLDYIECNGHRHGSYQKLDIYADSLYRCPEMIAIRNWLMGLPAPQAGEGEA